MIVRNAEVSDFKGIRKLCVQELAYQIAPLRVKSQLDFILDHDDQHWILVAEDDNQIVGFVHAQLYITLHSEPALNILGLAVSKKYQNNGIGKALMDHVESEALENDIHQIRLNSGIERVAAHRFYEKIGYEHNKDQARYGKNI